MAGRGLLRRRSSSAAPLAAALAIATAGLTAVSAAQAAPKTICTVTINSSDEREVFQRQLNPSDYRFVELVEKGNPDWFTSACRRGVTCDALIISGHFDDGTEFYTDRFDDREALTVHELQRASCSSSCGSVFAQLKEVYLFGCNTLKNDPRNVAGGEAVRSLMRAGVPAADAQRVAAQLSERYGESNRDRLRHIFAGVPVLYGFASKAPLGRYAGPMLERYFQSAPAGEVAAGKPSATLLGLFGPTSMISVAGLTSADPNAGFRSDMCGFADDQPTTVQKTAFLHRVLQREPSEVRLFLDHIERFVASVGPAERIVPAVASAFEAIEHDGAARGRFLAFARDADEASVQARMITLAHRLGWLSAEQERAEFVRLIGDRMARGAVGKHEVDLVCGSPHSREPGLARRLLESGAPRAAQVSHAAVLACLGQADAHERTLRALTSARDEEVEIAQVYLRHRPLADVTEVRAVTAGIARMTAAPAQVRALETLARQRLADPQSLQEIARLFPQARSLQVQRAIAGILLRSDTQMLGRAELARSLRQHRLKSPDGTDVIDVLIRLLQTT